MRLWYPSVDHLAERAFELREKYGALQAQDLRMIRGLVCGDCGGGPATPRAVGDRSRPGRWSMADFCATCGRPWKPERAKEVDVIRGEIKIYPRRGAAETVLADQADEWMRLEPIVFVSPRVWPGERWSFFLEAWRLWLHARVGGYTAVAVYGQAHSPAFRGMWTEKKVRYWLLRGRDVVTVRASRRPRLIASTRRAA